MFSLSKTRKTICQRVYSLLLQSSLIKNKARQALPTNNAPFTTPPPPPAGAGSTFIPSKDKAYSEEK